MRLVMKKTTEILHIVFLSSFVQTNVKNIWKTQTSPQKNWLFYLSSDPPIIKLIRRNPPPTQTFLGMG